MPLNTAPPCALTVVMNTSIESPTGILCCTIPNSSRSSQPWPPSAGIAVPDLEIDVADSGVEGAGAGIGGLTIGSAAAAGSASPAGCSPATARPASGAGPATGEEDHVPFIVLVMVAGSVFGQQEDRAGGSIADDADTDRKST